MQGQKTLHIRITGRRDNHPLHPDSLDVDEWIKAFENARDLLFPDGKDRPRMTMAVEEGSVLLKVTTIAALVIQTQALLAEVNAQQALGFLPKKQSDALAYFQSFAHKHQFTVSFGEHITEPVLSIDRQTELRQEKDEIWVDAELYLRGLITDIGGKTKPNIHLETDAYNLGKVLIYARREQLAEEEKNRLYKEQEIHIRIKQNALTGEYDPGTGELLAFIDHEETDESPDEYLDRLIRQATPAWSDVEDTEAWLREIRGYED